MKGQKHARVDLHAFIIRLVDDWNRDRAEDPGTMRSAVRVTKTIWAAEETTSAFLNDDANSLTIADVLKHQAIEFFGGHQWREMEEYINRLPQQQREQMNLQEFTAIFYDVLRDFGTPD